MAELPGVGRNLSDHPVSAVAARCAGPDGLFGATSAQNLDRYAAGQGPLTSKVAEAGEFIRTRDGLPAPDIQLFMMPVLYTGEGLAPVGAHGVSIGACLLTPRARGGLARTRPRLLPERDRRVAGHRERGRGTGRQSARLRARGSQRVLHPEMRYGTLVP
jgi:choline dehydrogenase